MKYDPMKRATAKQAKDMNYFKRPGPPMIPFSLPRIQLDKDTHEWDAKCKRRAKEKRLIEEAKERKRKRQSAAASSIHTNPARARFSSEAAATSSRVADFNRPNSDGSGFWSDGRFGSRPSSGASGMFESGEGSNAKLSSVSRTPPLSPPHSPPHVDEQERGKSAPAAARRTASLPVGSYSNDTGIDESNRHVSGSNMAIRDANSNRRPYRQDHQAGGFHSLPAMRGNERDVRGWDRDLDRDRGQGFQERRGGGDMRREQSRRNRDHRSGGRDRPRNMHQDSRDNERNLSLHRRGSHDRGRSSHAIPRDDFGRDFRNGNRDPVSERRRYSGEEGGRGRMSPPSRFRKETEEEGEIVDTPVELYAGGVPNDRRAWDDLKDVMRQKGLPILNLRHMKSNYAFVTFASRDVARRVLEIGDFKLPEGGRPVYFKKRTRY